MNEQIEILRGLFAGRYFEYQEIHYDLPAIRINPAPTASVPIYTGGHSDAALRRAARLAPRACIST